MTYLAAGYELVKKGDQNLSLHRHPRMFLSGVQSWFDYAHHDPELIEGSEFRLDSR
jgi:hypothetical protein